MQLAARAPPLSQVLLSMVSIYTDNAFPNPIAQRIGYDGNLRVCLYALLLDLLPAALRLVIDDVIYIRGMSRKPVLIPTGSLIFKDIILRGFWLSRWTRSASLEQRSEMLGTLSVRCVLCELEYCRATAHVSQWSLSSAHQVSSKQELSRKKVLVPKVQGVNLTDIHSALEFFSSSYRDAKPLLHLQN
jgi:hypothetical protein